MASKYKRIRPGDRFGMLTVISEGPRHITAGGEPKRTWVCACDCGGSSVAAGGNLRTGNTESCGCRKREAGKTANRSHGGSSDPEYAVWSSMIARCTRETDPSFGDYGGRGISVCPQWRDDYAAFILDMGRRPGLGFSIERIDNDGNYEPGNVKWATDVEQARNTRRNRIVEYNGRSMPLSEACEISGVPYGRAKNRIRDGWPEDKLFDPGSFRRSRKDAHWVEVDGERICLTEAAERAGLNYPCVAQRLKRGWPLDRALKP